MFKEDDEEYKKRIERARVLRNSVGMITDNDNINIQYDNEFQEKMNKAKELRNSVGMITSQDLEEPEENILNTNVEPQIDFDATAKNYLNVASQAIENVGKVPEIAYKVYEEQKQQAQQKKENEKHIYESLTDEQKKELDKRIAESKNQNIPLPNSTPQTETKQEDVATSIKNTGLKLATPEQVKNMQKYSNTQYKAWGEAEQKNENIQKGGVDAFNEYVDTILDNVFGGLAKKPIAGLANVATTITSLGIKGLESISKIFGLNEVGNNLNNAYNSVVDFGSDINEKANFESLITSQIEDNFTRTSGQITDIISNMVGNQLVGYAVGIPGTVAQGLSVGGSSAQEVLDENKDNIGQATITGLTKGYTSYLTEKMFDANLLTRGQSNSISKLVDNAISRNIQSKFGKEFANRLVGIVGENLEELVEDNVDNLIDKIVNNKDLPDFKQWWENTTETAKVTTISTLIMSFLGLGGETFENKEKDIQADKWINEAKKIIEQEDMTIHYNPEQVKSKNSMDQFYVSQFNQNGELEKVMPTLGKEIKNINPQLMITPVVVKDSNSNLYEVIDGATGVVLDNSYYDSVVEAENSYNDKVRNLSETRISDINNTINEASYNIQNNVMSLVTQLEQQLPEIAEQYYQNNISNSENFSQDKKTGTFNNETTNFTTKNVNTEYEQNSKNKTPEKSKFYEDKPNYAISNINEIETELNKKNSYSLEQIGETWSDIQENTYDLTPDDNMYVELEENNGKLEVVLYDGSTEEIPEVNRVAVEKTKNGRYTAEAINNAIKEVATIPNENSPIQGQVDIEGNIVKQDSRDINNIKEQLHNRIQNAIISKNSKGKTYLGDISDKVKNRIKKLLNIDVTGRRHVLADNDIRHMIKEHGDEKKEKAKGQIPITLNDIEKIPDILNSFDQIIVGNDNKEGKTIRYVKKYNDNISYVVEVVPEEGNALKIKTMWKKPVRVTNSQKAPSSTSKTKSNLDSTTSVTNSISQNNKSVKNEKNTISNNSMQSKENNTNIQDFGEKIGGARKDLSIPRTNTKPGKEVIHDYTVEKADNGYTVNFKGKLLNDGFKTQAEAEQYILDFKNNIKNNRAFVEERNSLLMTGGNKYSVYIRNPRTLKSQYTGKSFANKQDAENYAMALSMYLKENGKNLFRPQIQKVDRVNANNKNATKATGDDILNNFGFKGGEFGNWVKQSERQQFLNYAQDAFTDLAAALDITPDSLGQQGAMSIAFGARGQGLTGAVAHFEPGKKVINMTRLKGAGSLAHEYGHSIDNYLSREGGYDADGMVTQNSRNPKLSDNMKNAIKEVTDAMKYNVSTNQEEIDKKNAIYEKHRVENLEYNLRYIDKVFRGEAKNLRRIKGKYEDVPIKVTEKQKSDYKQIRNTLIDGKVTGDIDYKLNSQTLKTEKTYPEPINTLQKMYKEVVGRKLDDDTVYSLYRQGKQARQVTEVKSESGYSKSALELDKAIGRSSPYFSRIDEMWARAFESYISDKLKAKGIKDTYLVHSVNNNEYALFNPFPAGEERKNINKAFDNLIQTMKDEGYFTESEAPQNYDENTGIRYMKKNTSKTRTVQGLESYNIEDLKAAFKGDIEQILNDNDISDVDIVDIDLHGSRLRGTAKKDSDLDVVVQYNGDIREDDLFNILNENPLEIEGIKVDINPIQEDIKDYMERSNKYDQEVLTKNKSDSDIRYMKKNKASKQSLSKQFEEITGDSITRAEAKLAGIEIRNMQRQNGNLTGELEENPYSKEAMAIYNKYNNSKESSSYLYHSTPRENLQSIIENGLTIGNKQNQEGISSKDKIYLSTTVELAKSFTPNDSVTLRINPNFKLENLENDLLGGEGSYSITNNIPANMLQIKENGKWINLNNYTDYSDNNNQTSNIFKDYSTFYSKNSVDDKRFSKFFNEHKSDYDDWQNIAVESAKRDGKLTTDILNIDDNLVKLTTTKEGNKLYINELYVEKPKKGVGTKVVNMLKDYADKANLTIETDRELSTAKEFWDKTLNRNIKDNQGNTLSKQQQEYFANSKVRDENGKLMVLHHVTDKNFNVFDSNAYGKNTGEKLLGIYLSAEPIGIYGDVDMQVYANITNPVTKNDKNITKQQFMELLKGHSTESNAENAWRYFKDSNDLTILEKILSLYKHNREYINPQEFYDNVKRVTNYDGAIYDNYANDRISFVAFNSNQIKNTDNTNPTSNNDIRFAKRKAVDENLRNAERGESYIEQEIQKIEKTGDWDNSIPVTKLSDIRKTIEDYLGLGIKKGHFRQDAYAIYKGNNDVIRTKEYKDMDSILHETGHAIDMGKRLNIDKESIADELLTAIDKLGGYEEETRTIRLEEGFAEVIREYSIVPKQAKIDYPQTIAVLEGLRKTDKKFNDFITKVQQQSYNYIHQNPRNRTLSNISIGEQTDKQNITKNYIKQEVMRNIYDRDYVVKSAVNELAKATGKTTNQIKASENAYYLTRLASGKTDKVISMLSDGYIDEHGKKLMPGLNGIGDILGNDTQRWNDLRAYLVAQRDLEYKAKTLKTGIRTMDSKAVIDQFKNDKQIQQAAKLVYDTLDGVMQYTVDNGLISQETADKLKQSNAFYVPMHRVLDNRGNQVGRRGAVADIIQKRTGSELDVKDVLENIIANSSNMIQQVENNNILRALYKEGQTTGLTSAIYDVIDTPLTKIGTAQLSTWENELKKQGVNTTDLDLEKTIDLFAPNNKVDSKNLITSFINENGKRIYLQFNDELLFNSLMNIDKKFMSQVLKINSKMNMPLRYGATMANLGFAIPNMISDTAQAAVYSTAGFIPVVDNALGVLDILAATNKTVRNFVNSVAPEYAKRINNLYSLYQQSGATSSTRMSQYRESTQSLMADVYGTKSKTLGIKEKYKPLKRLLDVLTYIPEISEQSTRFRVFEKNYEMYKNKGTTETDARILAALESRDATQDFGRTGNITREINQLIPFSAARVGSAYTFAEKIKANPKQVGMRIALLTTLAMAIKAMGYDDDEIEELSQRKKDDNFVMRAGDKIITIKKPQGILRSIVNLAEYIQDLTTDHIEEGKESERLEKWLNNAIMDNMPADEVTGLVPNVVAPIIENAINKDFYYNTDIVKSYDLDLPDSEQYYDYNSQLAIWLGKIFNYSPAKIDNLISGYFGGLGTTVTNAMDYTLGKAGVIPEKPEMGAEQNTIGKRFIVNVNTNSSSIDEIYNRKTELTKLQNGGTITKKEEEELKTIKSAISNMSDLNKQIKEIKKDLTMSGTEKAEKIRVLQQEKTDTARKALGKDLIHTENETKVQSTQFYPNDTLKKNGYNLTLNSTQKKEYEQIANDFYTKYEKQGLYNKEKLEDIKSKAKEYAKNEMFKKYRANIVKTK